MPTLSVKLYSVFFKFLLKHRLQNRMQASNDEKAAFGVTSRPEESIAAANPVFTDGVATKDIHIDPFTSLSVRIFLPESALTPPDPDLKTAVSKSRVRDLIVKKGGDNENSTGSDPHLFHLRRNSLGTAASFNGGGGGGGGHSVNGGVVTKEESRRNSYGCVNGGDSLNSKSDVLVYRGYSPLTEKTRKLPVMLQFHGGGFVSGSNDSVANDLFCRRIAKLCDVIVLSVGYRLAPENRFPAAFEDAMKVLNWLGKQANLAECSNSMGNAWVGGGDLRKSDIKRHIVDSFGSSMVEPWLAAHGDPSRCVLLGVSCGSNIADYVARKAVEAGKLFDPVKVVAQVLMYPFFIGSIPTPSEIKLANSYFYDKAMCILAWKLFLPEDEFSLDHPAANPLIPGRGPPLKLMPPTLTIIAEHDWMKDRGIAYSEELRKVNVDAPVLEYKDAVHEFATLDMLIKSPEAQACAEDISIWVKKHISLRGHEFSY